MAIARALTTERERKKLLMLQAVLRLSYLKREQIYFVLATGTSLTFLLMSDSMSALMLTGSECCLSRRFRAIGIRREGKEGTRNRAGRKGLTKSIRS